MSRKQTVDESPFGQEKLHSVAARNQRRDHRRGHTSVFSACLVLLACAATALNAQNLGTQSVLDQQPHRTGNAPSELTTTGSVSNGTTGSTSLNPNGYVIGEQDSLMITVWKEKDISGNVVVRPDGKITVPLVGEINVVGMTPVQLQNLLSEKLKPFVTVPQVSVAVTEIRSRKVYLIGHAVHDGPFVINSATTVLQIIAQAGGLRDFAKRKKIYILRQQGNDQVRFAFNYDDVIKGKNTNQNILLRPGDTIVVP